MPRKKTATDPPPRTSSHTQNDSIVPKRHGGTHKRASEKLPRAYDEVAGPFVSDDIEDSDDDEDETATIET